MKTFRVLRRSASVTLIALTLGGCISIGFSGSGRIPVPSAVGDIARKIDATVGFIKGTAVYQYGYYFQRLGVMYGVDPFNYLASSIVETIADGDAPEHFSPEQQYYVGRGVSAALINEYGMADTNDPKVRAQLRYMNQMAGYINFAGRDGTGLWKGIHVGILENKRVGAYATPGGFVWVTRGALDLVQSEDELAALICHELGHVAKEHAIKAYVKDGGGKVKPNPFIKNLDMVNPVSRYSGNYFGSLAEDIAKNKYGKDQELEADQWGAATLQLAGYDSKAMIRLFNRVDAYEQKNPDRGAYLANHPPVSERIEELDDFMDDNKAIFGVTVSAEAKARRDARFKLVFGR